MIIVGVVAAIIVVVAGAAIVLTNSGSHSSSSYDDGDIVILTHDSKGEVYQVYKQAPERIIAGNDTALELLLYLGLGDKIVGVYYDEDEISDVVKDEYNKLKSRLDSKYFLTGLMSQAVATELEPDFIIGYKSSFGDGRWAVGTTEYWNNLGCNIMSLNTQAGDTTVRGLNQDWNDIGKIFDVQKKTDAFLNEYDKVISDAKSGKTGTKVALVEYSPDSASFYAYGDKSFIGNELTACGGINAFPEGGNISEAQVVDGTDIYGMVVIAFGDVTPAQKVKMIRENPNFQYVPAVADNNMVGIGLSGTYGGPSCLSTIKAIASLLGVEEKQSSYSGGPITITTHDSTGEVDQTYTKAPTRIIAGNDTVLELLLYMGLGDNIVGVYYDEDEISDIVKDEYDRLKARLDPKYFLTGLMSQAVATELNPDFIIGYKSSFGDGRWAVGTTAYWNAMGCNIMSLNTQAGDTTVNGLKKDYTDIGRIFDIEEKTNAFIAEYEYYINSASGASNKIALVEYNPDSASFYAYGDRSFIGNELTACGGVNAFPEGGNISEARVVDGTDIYGMVVIAFGDVTPAQKVQMIKENPNFQYVPAVINDNIVGIGLSGTYGGPSALKTIELIVQLLGVEGPGSSYDDGPITITTHDSTGEVEQTYTKAPTRIIAGNDTALELLLYMGLGDNIVGVYYDEDEISDVVKDEYDRLKARLDPKYFLTGLMSQAVATELEPDFIIGYKSSFGDGRWAVGTTAYWNAMGCNIMSLNTQAGDTTVNGLKQDYTDIGKIFDIEEKTNAFIAEYEYIINSASGEARKIALVEYNPDSASFYAYGNKSFIGNELTACGGINAFPEGGNISEAQVIDGTDIYGMVVIAFGDVTPAEKVQMIKENPNFQYVPAVINDNIVGIGLSGTYGGPSALKTIELIVQLLNFEAA